MEQRDQSLSTRDLASPSPGPEAGTERDDEVLGGSPSAERGSVGEPTDSDMVTPGVGGSDRPPATEQPSRTSAASGSEAPDLPQTPANGNEGNGTLLSTDLSTDFQARWESIQTQFVDEPRGAVQDADKLVATVMQQLAEGFAQERERLESQWDRGEDISTEDLRVALRRYRSFFQRLLSA